MAKYPKRQKVKRYRRSFYSREMRVKKGIGIAVLVLVMLGAAWLAAPHVLDWATHTWYTVVRKRDLSASSPASASASSVAEDPASSAASEPAASSETQPEVVTPAVDGTAVVEGSWAEAVQHYEKAAEAGSAEALALLGDCLYQGRGARRSKVQARRMWKKAAQAGEVQAMIALGDDCAASGGEMAETLQYYRRAQSAAREVPDIAYTPQVCLRLAQYETQYLSRKKALLQVAEAVQGFRILQAEGETDAAAWLREAELLTDQLLADDKNA